MARILNTFTTFGRPWPESLIHSPPLKGITVRSKIDNAAHLELDWGARIREHLAGTAIAPGDLSNWLLTSAAVSVPTRVCQHWLTRDWASSGELLVPQAVEQELGDKLRLDEYKQSFADEAYDISDSYPIHNLTFLEEQSFFLCVTTCSFV